MPKIKKLVILSILSLSLTFSGFWAVPASADEPTPEPSGAVLVTHDQSQLLDYHPADSSSNAPVNKITPLAPALAPSIEYSGTDRFETASLISRGAFAGGAEGVIITRGSDFPDALSATALAGTLNYPILLTQPSALSQFCANEIKRLRPKIVYVIGDEASVDGQVFKQLENIVGAGNVKRLAGSDRFKTAAEVREKILATNQQSKTLIITNGYKFADSLSIAPYAVKSHSPILLTYANGELPSEFKDFLSKNVSANGLIGKGFNRILLLGSSESVANSTQKFCEQLAAKSNVIRLGGSDRYETSTIIAKWSVDNAGMSYQGFGIASGTKFPDGLTAGVLQGKNNTVLHLISDDNIVIGRLGGLLAVGDSSIGRPVLVNFFGDTNSVSKSARNQVLYRSFDVLTTTYNITLDNAVAFQMKRSPQVSNGSIWVNATAAQVKLYMDPSTVEAADFYQFAVLSSYTGLQAADINSYIASAAPANSDMRGKGADFVDAAKTQGINEVYLVTHAGLETAWGAPTTVLSHGSVYKTEWGGDGKTYYNYFGIGAYDSNPIRFGTEFAAQQGWDTPAKAIVGGAKFVKQAYIGDPQTNTLYKMRWNPGQTALGINGKQYATDIRWAENIALLMGKCYLSAATTPNIKYDIPAYL